MIEVNGPANIILEIDTACKIGRPVNVDLIERMAHLTVGYMRAHDTAPTLSWNAFVKRHEGKEYDSRTA